MNFYHAFEMSPVPEPARDAEAPEPFRGIYGMPMFITVPTPDLASSSQFWQRALGFIELFSIPEQLIHLRRWAFQDVLLVPAEQAKDSSPAMSVSFACVLRETDQIVSRCESLRPGCVTGPTDTSWNSVDVEVITPENVRVIFTAAKPLDPHSEQAKNLAAVGIEVPDENRA
jgi:hypothetical protein